MTAQQRYVKTLILKHDTDLTAIDTILQAGNILILKIITIVTKDTARTIETIREIKDIIEDRERDIARLDRSG